MRQLGHLQRTWWTGRESGEGGSWAREAMEWEEADGERQTRTRNCFSNLSPPPTLSTIKYVCCEWATAIANLTLYESGSPPSSSFSAFSSLIVVKELMVVWGWQVKREVHWERICDVNDNSTS